jgi:hypothetical protein
VSGKGKVIEANKRSKEPKRTRERKNMSGYQVEVLLRPTKELVPHMPLMALTELAACWRKAPECEPLVRIVEEQISRYWAGLRRAAQ